jgi:hypothetical protein
VAITSIKTGSSFTNLVKYNDFLGPNAAFNPSSYESIASADLNGISTTTFSSIPSTYKHLQLRFLGIESSLASTFRLRFNGDTGANYARHWLYGDGSSATAGGTASTSVIDVGSKLGILTEPCVGIIDIQDYTSTSINKTVRSFSGHDRNGAGEVGLYSGVWLNTSAITSITFFASAGNQNSGATIALYGIK